MLLLMTFAAVVSVVQLGVLGSWGRSLRLTTLLQGVIVGFLVCGLVTVAVQFAWTRLFAAVSGIPLADVQQFASWAIDPLLEEVCKVAPLVLLAWLRPRIHRQLGYTDHLLYGASLGIGFEVLEAALRHTSLGYTAMATEGGFIVTANLAGAVFVPSPWTALTTWQPVPAGYIDWLSEGGDTIQHLVWTALAAVGIAWLARRRDGLRLLGLVPLVLAMADHGNDNLRVVDPDPGFGSDLLSWIGGLLSTLLILVLIAATAVDRITQAQARTRAPLVLLPDEPAHGLSPVPVARLVFSGGLWSAWVGWQFVLSRRAAMTALAAGEEAPHLRDAVVTTAGELVRAQRRPDAAGLWREAIRRIWTGIDWRALRSPRMILWAVALLPALLYTLIGAFPATTGVQDAMETDIGLWLVVAALLVGATLTILQLRRMRRALTAVSEPSLHERRLRPLAQLVSAFASLTGSALLLVIALVERGPSGTSRRARPGRATARRWTRCAMRS